MRNIDPSAIGLRIVIQKHAQCVGEKRNAYRNLVGKSGEKRPLRRPRHRFGGNITIKNTCFKDVDWIRMA
jgi:hypothetical protein